MKTLREYIDQLDEISRRDFLKGAGAAAIGAAAGVGGKVAYDNNTKPTTIPPTEQAYYLAGMFSSISAYSVFNKKINQMIDRVGPINSDATMNLQTQGDSVKNLRLAYDKGFDAGRELVNHVGLPQATNQADKVRKTAELAQYLESYYQKYISLK